MAARMPLVIAALLAAVPYPALARLPVDPLGSPTWTALGATFSGADPVRFDPRIKVIFPEIAENQRSFPNVKREILFADLNPIPLAIDYSPTAAAAYLSTRIKLDQRTPVRGAVQLADGTSLGTMQIEASVAEDPTITVMPEAAVGDRIVLAGIDTNGIAYDGTLSVRAAPAAR